MARDSAGYAISLKTAQKRNWKSARGGFESVSALCQVFLQCYVEESYVCAAPGVQQCRNGHCVEFGLSSVVPAVSSRG